VLLGVRRLFPKSERSKRDKRWQLRIAGVFDELRKFGYRVFHELRHDGLDLDYVIVGPAGVFAIETRIQSGDEKAESKPRRNLSRAAEENSSIEKSAGKKNPKSTRENQVKVNRVIRKHREFDGWVWPLVVIAGEWRVKNDPQTVGARLFTIDKLVNHIMNQPSRLTSTEIKLVTSHLERLVKSTARFKKKSSVRQPEIKGASYLNEQAS